MKARFETYRPKRILNVRKHADHWFWTRYSAYPYVGCQHGCAFCYCRERKYASHDDPADFSRLIRIKEDAPEMLRRELTRVPRDVISLGDYQPAERRFQLSRRMLEVALDLSFPVFVLERSDLVLRDLDLIVAIGERAAACVLFSAIATPESPHYGWITALENLAPVAERRFAAMEKLAAAGILTGTALMPVLPYLSDDETTLEAVVRRTAESGGRFVLVGGLTLADQQRRYFLDALSRVAPEFVARYEELYAVDAYMPPDGYWHRIAQRVAKLCANYGLGDRMPRPIAGDDPLALNKRVAQCLADESYHREVAEDSGYRVWAYRRAAWAIDDLREDVGELFRREGVAGLRGIPYIGQKTAAFVESCLTGEGE